MLRTDSELNACVLKAINRASSAAVLAELSKDEDPLIRELVAGNISCPPQILRELSKDSVDDVREAVAKNISAPEDVLIGLGFDKDRWVRVCIIYNPSSPAEALCMVALRECGGTRDMMPKASEAISKDRTKKKNCRQNITKDQKSKTEIGVKKCQEQMRLLKLHRQIMQ